MHYTTYWSILDSSSQTIKSNNVCLLIAIIAGLLWFLIKKFKQDNNEGDKTILLWATATFSALGLSMYILFTFFFKDSSYSNTLKMLDSATTPKVEGTVTNFEQTYRNSRFGGETIESFTIDSLQFAYGDAPLGRFNSFSQTNNNIIYNGQSLRVTYKKGSPYGDNFNSILRLEIRE